MHEPNPYKKNTLIIDETKPLSDFADGLNIECIDIRPSRDNFEAKPDEKALNQVMNSIRKPKKIKAFVIDYNSKLKNLPNIKEFENLEYFHVAGRKIKAYDNIESFKKLKNVFVAGYKGSEIKLASKTDLEYFRAIRGSLKRIDFNSIMFLLQSCGKLEKTGSINSRVMCFEGCHQLDLDSLANVIGLKRLQIRGRKKLESLSFLSECKDLQEVIITATSMRDVDLGSLNTSTSLKKLFLGQCSKPLIRKFSEKAPSILISNGDLTLIGAEEKKLSDYYESAKL